MSSNINTQNVVYPIQAEIESHPAWHGHITGLHAEDLLKDLPPYTFLIRAGETPVNYYISYVEKDGMRQHRAFVVTFDAHSWGYRNAVKTGPNTQPFTDFIHKIIHCEQEECKPMPALTLKRS